MYESCKRSRASGATRASGKRSVQRNKQKQLDRINALKLARGCADCGYNLYAAALQFDHVRGDKEFNIASAIGSTWSTLEAEIAKCDVVCANCHAVRTYERGYYSQVRKEVGPEQRQYLLGLHTLVRGEFSELDAILGFTTEQKAQITDSIKACLYLEATNWAELSERIDAELARPEVTRGG